MPPQAAAMRRDRRHCEGRSARQAGPVPCFLLVCALDGLSFVAAVTSRSHLSPQHSNAECSRPPIALLRNLLGDCRVGGHSELSGRPDRLLLDMGVRDSSSLLSGTPASIPAPTANIGEGKGHRFGRRCGKLRDASHEGRGPEGECPTPLPPRGLPRGEGISLRRASRAAGVHHAAQDAHAPLCCTPSTLVNARPATSWRQAPPTRSIPITTAGYRTLPVHTNCSPPPPPTRRLPLGQPTTSPATVFPASACRRRHSPPRSSCCSGLTGELDQNWFVLCTHITSNNKYL